MMRALLIASMMAAAQSAAGAMSRGAIQHSTPRASSCATSSNAHALEGASQVADLAALCWKRWR
jgi:hypothetical protein